MDPPGGSGLAKPFPTPRQDVNGPDVNGCEFKSALSTAPHPFPQLSHSFYPSSMLSVCLGRGGMDNHLKAKHSTIMCSQHFDLQKEDFFFFGFDFGVGFLTQTDASTNLWYSKVIWTGTSCPFSKTGAVISPTRVSVLHSEIHSTRRAFFPVESLTSHQKAVRYHQQDPLLLHWGVWHLAEQGSGVADRVHSWVPLLLIALPQPPSIGLWKERVGRRLPSGFLLPATRAHGGFSNRVSPSGSGVQSAVMAIAYIISGASDVFLTDNS